MGGVPLTEREEVEGGVHSPTALPGGSPGLLMGGLGRLGL